MSTSFRAPQGQIQRHTQIPADRSRAKASPAVRLATLSDEALLWELGLLHATRATCGHDLRSEVRIVELEGEYLRRHPLREAC